MTSPTQDAAERAELEACPFCGSHNISSGESLVSDDEGYGKQTGCEDCGALGPIVRIVEDHIIGPDASEVADAAWNRRAALSAPQLAGDAALTDAYAEGRRDEQQELASVLPGTTYMDPPDGGSPTILEQLQRQARDAKRYLWLRDAALAHDATRNAVNVYEFVGPIAYGPNIDAAIDTAIQQQEGK
jgi:hypothetical protein